MSTDAVTATPPGTAEPLADNDSRVAAPAAGGVVLWPGGGIRTLADRGIVLPGGGWVVVAVVVAVVVDVIVTVAVILEMDTTGATITGAADVDVGLLLGAAAAQTAGAVAVVDLKPLTTTRTTATVRTAKPVSTAARLLLAATAGAGVLAGTSGVARRKGFRRSPAGSWFLPVCSAVSSGLAASVPQGTTSSLSSAFTGPPRRFPDRCRCRRRREHVGGTVG